jgi:hypothetical protein
MMFSDVKILFQQALAKVLPEHWKNNITHVKKVESQMWEIDNLTDSTIEEIIINIVMMRKKTKRLCTILDTESWPQLIIYRQFLT